MGLSGASCGNDPVITCGTCNLSLIHIFKYIGNKVVNETKGVKPQFNVPVFPKIPMTEINTPVSYTHLDVYKRQFLYWR